VTALPRGCVPGPADLHPVDRRDDVVVARAADDRVRRELAHRPGQHRPGSLAGECLCDVGAGLLGAGTEVYQSSHSRPSAAAAASPPACSAPSGSSRTPWPSRVAGTGWIIDQKVTRLLNPPYAMRFMSNGIASGFIIAARRGSLRTFLTLS
jgi:hypothetical protein